MDFTDFEYISVIQTYVSKRDLCVLSFINKSTRVTLLCSSLPPGSSLMIAFEKPVHESNSEYSLEKIRDELKELIENFKKTRLVL